MSDAPDLVELERTDDGVAWVRLRNGKVNSLSIAVLERLHAIAGELHSDPPGAVVVTGSERIFAAGADISEFGGPDEARRIGRLFVDALGAVAAIPRMVIAAVSGPALGGGCELALACDLRIASSTARFGQPEILLGIIPGGGGTQRLARLVGPSRAKDLVLSGRNVTADEAYRIGLVDEVVDAASFDSRVRELAASYAAGPVQAHAIAKRVIDAGLDTTLAVGLELEQDGFAEVFATDDARLGVTSFLENGPGKAVFTGR
ncbi:MAG: enoyl-CoA hydratase/isomerase family protein [Acidimicrobiia bacterium]|nr:enoyl-CoA hydratase/isomerase family protein [Acidimicrobiia bacterium]